MNEELKKIFSKLEVNKKLVETAHIEYTGKSKTYVVWTLLEEEPELSGDDEELYTKTPVDIDIYSDGNYLAIMKEIKKIMKENEWIWTGDSEEMYEKDTGLYHRTITFEKEGITNG